MRRYFRLDVQRLNMLAWVVVAVFLGACEKSPTEVQHGVEWTRRISGTTAELLSVTWTGTQVVAVGEGGVILTSPDGIEWTQRSSGTTRYITSVTWTGDRLLAVGEGGRVLTSLDGTSWTLDQPGFPTLLSVASRDGQVVAAGLHGTILTSPDGNVWTSRTSGTSEHLQGLAWTGSQWVAVGGDNGWSFSTNMPTNSSIILTSPDGVTWTTRSSGSAYHLRSVAHAGDLLVAVGGLGTVLTSPNGESWTLQEYVGDENHAVTWTGKQIVVMGGGGAWTSHNGEDWVMRAYLDDNYLSSVTWTGKRLVAVGDRGRIYTSP